MDPNEEKKKKNTSSCFSVASDKSKEEPLTFSEGNSRTKRDATATTSASVSVSSYKSKDEDLYFNKEDGSKMDPVAMKSPSTVTSASSYMSKDLPVNFKIEDRCIAGSGNTAVEKLFTKQEISDAQLPPLMEDWSKEDVKDWLVQKLRIPKQIAQNLYDQELTGSCLTSFQKEDFLELGVPRALTILILREALKFRGHPPMQKPDVLLRGGCERMDESFETETVSSDSGIQSLSPAVEMLQTARNRIKSILSDKTTDTPHPKASACPAPTPESAESSPKLISRSRPFDKHNTSLLYKENAIFAPAGNVSNLLDPIHEYILLSDEGEASDKEILYEFTKEVSCFAASCMNSRTNGTIHFGVRNKPDSEHGKVIGQRIASTSEYKQAFDSCLGQFFEEQHVNCARMCVRPPEFIQIRKQDGTISDKWVVEVDVVPSYSQTLDNLFYTRLGIAAADQAQHNKTVCLFIRDGQRSTNVLQDPNPRVTQEVLISLANKVKIWASERKSAEEKKENSLFQSHQGQRLKQLVTRGKDALESSLQVILVTDRCHERQLEFMDFVKELKLFAVLEFDPESDVTGTCKFYRKDHIANLHFPKMYTSQESITTIIRKLNLFHQTSWIFCNGKMNEESEAEKPLTPSEWLKKRSGEVNNTVTLLCNPDVSSRDRLLVIFLLHSSVTDISDPILETFCAIYRTLEGTDNMLCLCSDVEVFNHWKSLIDIRCKEDITNKCIYELSLNEISGTIKKLLQPRTQSSKRYLPATGHSSVLLTKKDEELMTVLDILTENECENTEIETNESFQEFKKKTEEDFYRGGQVTWWNFYLSEGKDCLPFIKRDKYNELYDLITPVEPLSSSCAIITLFHPPGCGGTTLAMHVLWNLRKKFRCAVVRNTRATNTEIAGQVINLLTFGKQNQPGHMPVLLLVDNCEDVEDLKQCILNDARERRQQINPMVVILNCERTQFPDKSSRNSRIPNVFMTNKLSLAEQALFSEKLKQLEKDHEKPKTFYAFMIMTSNFSESYIGNVVSNIVGDLDTATPQGKLFCYLALLNTFVNGSYMSLSLCEELVGIRNPLWKQETLEEKMNPYSSLLITFKVEEHGTYQAVRFLHQMIARHCLDFLKQHNKMSLSEMTTDILHCDKLYNSCMGKDFLYQHIQSMLVTRHRKEQGNDKDTLFSPLIEKIHEEEGQEKIKEVLTNATNRFDRSATLPQALARHFYLKEKDFNSAVQWALDAQGKNSNSYIADTVGQIYKSQLKVTIEESEFVTPEVLKECLILASNAVKAFQYSQDLAKSDEQVDPYDVQHRKRPKTYNTSGYVGEIEVMMILLDTIKDLPLSDVTDKIQKNKLQQFLKGSHSLKTLCHDHSNTTAVQLVTVMTEHEKFLTSLKPRLKEIFIFFENFYIYLKPRSQERETADERNKRKLTELFKKYIEIFSKSEEEKASQKASHPNLSLQQEIRDQRDYLEMKRVDSFAGLLQCLSEKKEAEMEFILKKWQFIFEQSNPRSGLDTVNYILANIVMHCIRPSSKHVKSYDELIFLLNELLQKEGTRSGLTEMYYLSMLLMWPGNDRHLESTPAHTYISTYIASGKKAFHKRFLHMFPARSALAHFFLGNSSGLKRIVSKVELDKILVQASQEDPRRRQGNVSRNLHDLWQNGRAWSEPEVQRKLRRVKGKSENGEIYINYGGNLKMQARPAYLGGIRTGYSREDVSFYLGFTMEGPVAYDIKYLNEQ